VTPDREDDGLLDRLIGQILEQPFPEDPPAEVRRRVLALGQLGPPNHFPGGPSLSAWLRTAVAAASLLLVTDLCWRLYVNSTKPACWFRAANSDTWLVMYENARIEISSPPKDLRKGP
jgi:hypothetical protein